MIQRPQTADMPAVSGSAYPNSRVGARRSATVTLQDVAELAGVSAATASRAFNGSKDRTVGDHLRERVLEAARKLNYRPNPHAQAIARGSTDVVGLMIHDITDPYFSSIAAGVIEEAEKHGLLVTIVSTNRGSQRELDFVATLRQQRARALIIAGSRTTDKKALHALQHELELYEASGGRAVLISQRLLPVDTITLENRAGARDLATALTRLGHRDFGVLAADKTLLTSSDRVAGFRDGLSRGGAHLRPEHVIHAEFTRGGGYGSMQALLGRRPDITCVFAANDVMALGALAALREHGLEAGHDVAIAGFDDIPAARDLTPSLTSVRAPTHDLGRAAMELVLSEKESRARLRRVRGEVHVRESTPPPTPGRTLATALKAR